MSTHIRMVCGKLVVILALLSALPATAVHGQEAPQVETVLDGLNQPCGLAIHPTTGAIYISESGAQKIIRLDGGTPEDVIVGFPSVQSTNNYPFRLAPLGLTFLDGKSLAVGIGGEQSASEKLFLFTLRQADSGTAIAFDQAVDRVRLEDANNYSTFGLAQSPLGIYATCLSEQQFDWIARWATDNGATRKLTRFVNTTETVALRSPTAITISPDGFVAVALIGAQTSELDSVLAFFDESSGDLKAQFDTGLRDVVALSYSPIANRLFALDFSFAEPSQAGLFKLVARANNTQCEAIRLLDVDRPTAMAFDREGNLYVTALGGGPTVAPDGGKLFKVSGLDVSRQAQADASSKDQ